jgi:hypothetical protein
MNSVSKEYFKPIKRYMKASTFAGLVGGKPGQAYYFCGHLEEPAGNFEAKEPDEGDEYSLIDKEELEVDSEPTDCDRLIFLDPHFVIPQAEVADYKARKDHFHCL